MKLLLIIPAYNEEANILNTVAQIRRFQSTAMEQVTVDYIVINDGSTDRTEQVCRENGINCLSLIRNLGIGGAVQTGYMYAYQKGYDIAVQFDGDGQHDIRSLPDLIRPILSGQADFVVGSRFLEGNNTFQSTFMRRLGIRNLSFLIRLVCRVRVMDVTSPPETVTISEDAIMNTSIIGCSYLFMGSSISIVVVHCESYVSSCAAAVECGIENSVNEVAGLDLDGICRGIGIRYKEGADEIALIVKGSYICL